MKRIFKGSAFGVGPIYVLLCLCFTIIGLCLRAKGFLSGGEIKQGSLFFYITGFAFLVFAVYLWAGAVIVEKINKKAKEGTLVTSGVYGIVRNPIYTAFLFLFTALLLFARNYILLLLPPVFWIFLTILLKNTEEKWLKETFGKEYELYCKNVNRIIPCFFKK